MKITKTLEVTGPVLYLCHCLCLGSFFFGWLLSSAKHFNTFHRAISTHEWEGGFPECGLILFLCSAMMKNFDLLKQPETYSMGS